ncbi:LysM peptidoglycan-binding domain-containing protein [Deinococcus malanensis]|uniref:LysM peptidoglycan-binding domain-containing protein n=1 Tax=Deinococcus malanensis TaxID=1706855 RepID=UPI00362E1F8D
MPESAFPALRFLLLTCALSAGVAAAQGETSGSSTKGASVSSPSLPAGQPVTAQPQTVVVQAGDTAYNLARRAGIPVEALLSLNGLSSPDLRVGQVLRLREVPVTHVVQPGETLYALARQYAVSVDVLLGLNSLAPEAKIAVGQVLKLPAVAAQKSSGAQPSAVHPASVQATQAPAVGNAPQVSLTGFSAPRLRLWPVRFPVTGAARPWRCWARPMCWAAPPSPDSTAAASCCRSSRRWV